MCVTEKESVLDNVEYLEIKPEGRGKRRKKCVDIMGIIKNTQEFRRVHVRNGTHAVYVLCFMFYVFKFMCLLLE